MNGLSPSERPTVLIDVHDLYKQSLLELLLRTDGYRPVVTAHLPEALRILRELELASAVLTESLGRRSPDLTLAAEIHKLAPSVPVILMTARRLDLEAVQGADFLGAFPEPYSPEALLRLLQLAVRRERRRSGDGAQWRHRASKF